jgi:hypothetical protein
LAPSAASAIQTSPLITTVAADGVVARIAAELRATRSQKLPEAIVIASAIATGANVPLTNDRQVVHVVQDYVRAVYFDDREP